MRIRSRHFIAMVVLCGATLAPGLGGETSTASSVDATNSSTERRLDKLEAEQTETIKSLQVYLDALKSQNEASGRFITVFGALVGVLIALQSAATVYQFSREHARDERASAQKAGEVAREEQRLGSELSGADKVGEVLTVVKQTLDARLTAEKEARNQARKEIEKREEIEKKYSAIDQFVRKYQETISKARTTIENLARECAEYRRHQFKAKIRDFNRLAEKYDTFEAEHKALETEPLEFSARVIYVRGIAAHHANELELAKECFEKVADRRCPDPPQERADGPNKRIAIACYFLGLIHSNFGHYDLAVQELQKTIDADVAYRDFLSRVAAADAYALSGSTEDRLEAEKLLSEMIKRLTAKEQADKGLPLSERRQKSRAALIRANMAINTRNEKWQQAVLGLLDPVYAEDPRYYYATVTLAQVCHDLGQSDRAAKLFRETCAVINDSGDLVNVTEARSRTLLLMTAGLCHLYRSHDEERAKEYLDEAIAKLGELPTVEGKSCLVFSVLTKRNVTKEIIETHIGYIRQGRILGEPT